MTLVLSTLVYDIGISYITATEIPCSVRGVQYSASYGHIYYFFLEKEKKKVQCGLTNF